MKSNVTHLARLHLASENTYRFVDRDPVIEDLLFCMDGSGLTDSQIAARSMCSWQTVHNIRAKTKRPQNYTIDRILSACGLRRVFVDRNNHIIKTR
jgi:tRNA splicing ligase